MVRRMEFLALWVLMVQMSSAYPPRESKEASNLDSVEYIYHVGNQRPSEVQTLQQIVFRDDKTLEIPVDATEDEAQSYLRRERQSSTGSLVDPGDTGPRILSGSKAQAEIPNSLAPITSNVPVRLELGGSTSLYGSPGESVSVEFYLTNYGPSSGFFFSAQESQSADPDQVNFPVDPFLSSLSTSTHRVNTNDTFVIFMNLYVPPGAAAGTRRTITFVAQSMDNFGTDGGRNSIVRRIYFTVSDNPNAKTNDKESPRCTVLSEDRETLCNAPSLNPDVCHQVRWTARFEIQDAQSGLRSIQERPLIIDLAQDAHFSYQNFIFGSQLPVEYFFSGSCCLDSFVLNIADVAGNEGVCLVGKYLNSEGNINVQGASTSGVVIAVSVSAVILVVVIIAAIVAVVLIKKKRKADLAEMRATPQER